MRTTARSPSLQLAIVNKEAISLSPQPLYTKPLEGVERLSRFSTESTAAPDIPQVFLFLAALRV